MAVVALFDIPVDLTWIWIWTGLKNLTMSCIVRNATEFLFGEQHLITQVRVGSDPSQNNFF
jgi:hypothetical protein